MKNKKGFTLVELLAVIVIIGLIATIAIPAILSASDKMKEKLYESKIELAVDALQTYGTDNPKCIIGTGVDCPTWTTCSGDEIRTCTITLGEMARFGLISYDNNNAQVIDPRDKSDISSYKLEITYKKANKSVQVGDKIINP